MPHLTINSYRTTSLTIHWVLIYNITRIPHLTINSYKTTFLSIHWALIRLITVYHGKTSAFLSESHTSGRRYREETPALD